MAAGTIIRFRDGRALEPTFTLPALQTYQPYDVVLFGPVGTTVGRYRKIANGVDFEIHFTASAQGSGTFEFSIPFPMVASSGQFTPVGGALSRDISAGGFFFGTTFRGAASDRVGLASGNGAVSDTFPFTVASGDLFYLQGNYESTP